jgi:kynurenine 3-monooxygenase
VLDLFRREFPDAVPLVADLEREFHGRPVGTLGTVRCDRWHDGDRVLLIGDAAHAIVPFFGQGMNAGFEDCTILGELLDRDERTAFAALTERRRPDTDAIAAMALDNFVEMRDRVGDPQFLLHKAVEHRLELEMPEAYRSRYGLVMYTDVPFRVAEEVGRVQQGILSELCAGIDDPAAADLERARTLVRERLEPLFRAHGVRLP